MKALFRASRLFRIRPISWPFLSLACVLCGLSAVPGASDARAHRTPVVLVLITSPERGQDEALRSLIVDSVKLELESRDIRAVTSDVSSIDASAVYRLSSDAKADFAVAGSYTRQGGGVVLQLVWYDIGRKIAFPPSSTFVALDLSFDTVVTGMVGGILDKQKESLSSLPPAPPPAAVAAAPAVAPAHAPVTDQAPLPARPAAPKVTRLAFSLSAAPFIPVFKASAYIPSVGLSISGEGEYRFPVAGGLLGLCGVGGVSLIQADKGSLANLIAVPVGAGVVYRTLTGSVIDFAVSAAAGPAFLALTPAGGESVTGVVPFLMAGVELNVALLEHLGLSVQFAYVSYFVQDVLMGFNPSLALTTRF